MLPTAVIAFREFFEAFLIVGVFLGVSKALGLKREVEIALAASLGILMSLVLVGGTYFFSGQLGNFLTERTVELLEGYVMVFSGLFLVYVIFSLHSVMSASRKDMMGKAEARFKENVFDISLFFTIVFLVIREGFEIALFTASIALLTTFIQNFLGLLLGLTGASVLGISTFFAYTRFPIRKIFKITEYMVILLGASLTQNGITKLFENYFNIHLSNIVPINLFFLPDAGSVGGHLIRSLIGIEQEFSLVRLGIMLVYIALIYVLFMRTRTKKTLITKE
ncbi:MAG: Uncharacterized protein Greene07147_205 [Parcubacteria group bacterium Greene0714_7]|nr:MAG: Uncharacterized protein Greene07147_205 [Parcubacteria group bacterium Greene0714_7]